ncbi:MAG: sigma-70 family RNA polymerase sigma factor [Xanthobacteraceae bacterium]
MTPANDNTPQQRPAWFDELLLKYDGFIRVRCAQIAEQCKIESEDLHHDVLLEAMERWYRYRPNGNFVAWISYVIRGCVSPPRRKMPNYQYAPASSLQPSQEFAVCVEGVLGSLQPAERNAVSMIAAGYTGEEAGVSMGISRQRVWQIVERARAKVSNDNEPKKRAKVAAKSAA